MTIAQPYLYFQIDRHRYSTDDVVTAWYAKLEAERSKLASPKLLDQGCGIGECCILRYANHAPTSPSTGSVALMLSWLFSDCAVDAVEAQSTRITMARRSARYNGVDERMRFFEGDLRAAETLPLEPCYDLITGTPPYFPVGQVRLVCALHGWQ